MSALLIDVGNSRIKWRFVPDEQPHTARDPANDGVLPLEAVDRLAEAWRRIGYAPDSVLTSNVARPDIDSRIEAVIAQRWGGLPVRRVIPDAFACGIVNGYRTPLQLGPDRWLALIGAHDLLPGRSLLVCSFGTATTIDLLVARASPAGAALFVGGLILPGIETMRRALARGTARLPAAAGQVVDFGVQTDDAIASGVMAAQVGAVERALANGRRRVSPPDALNLVLAGGAAHEIEPFLADLDVERDTIPDLVLRGMERMVREPDRLATQTSTID